LEDKLTAHVRHIERTLRVSAIGLFLAGIVPVLMLLMLFILAKALKRPAPAGALALAGANGMTPALAGMGADGGSGLNVLVGDDALNGVSVEQALNGGTGKIIPMGSELEDHTFGVIAEQFDENLESILHLAKSKPETVALLVKSWMMTEDKK